MFNSLKSLGWIKAEKGYLPEGGKDVPNVMRADGVKPRLMRKNLNAINDLLSEQAICLTFTNHQLKAMCQEMADRNYKIDSCDLQETRKPLTLNFSHVHLRRIFARGQMNLGGRFYGGWWQNIPKNCHRYITINSCQTVEVDFSTLHPTLLFLENKLDSPAQEVKIQWAPTIFQSG